MTRSALDTHWLLLCYGRIVGCRCGITVPDEDMGFLDGINAASAQ